MIPPLIEYQRSRVSTSVLDVEMALAVASEERSVTPGRDDQEANKVRVLLCRYAEQGEGPFDRE